MSTLLTDQENRLLRNKRAEVTGIARAETVVRARRQRVVPAAVLGSAYIIRVTWRQEKQQI